MSIETEFSLDKKLQQDSYVLCETDTYVLLLMRNALFPWFVIVPVTTEIEFYRLNEQEQFSLLRKINALSRFIEQTFPINKLNIASIGNVVSQLHVHVIGRRTDDRCWPNVAWGTKHFEAYTEESVKQIKAAVEKSLLIEFNNI